MVKQGARPDRIDAFSQHLGQASWAVVLLGIGSTFVLPGSPDEPAIRTALVVTLGVFFTLLLARLILTATRHRGRRIPLLLLTGGIALWAVGAATVSAGQTVSAVTFPAPGEVLYLTSYFGIAAFLLLDVPRLPIATAAVWLEAAVLCGAAACVAAIAVLTPLASAFPEGGLVLLLSILYPLIDLVLGTIVLAQMLLHQRERSVGTAALALGFVGLAIADSSFVIDMSTSSYTSSVVLDAMWGASFGLIVGAACSRQRTVVRKPVGGQNSAVLLVGSGVALAVLVVHPGGLIGWFMTVPAIITLVSAGARMLVALHEAQGAASALRLSLTDELTGLPNRRAILAVMDDALSSATPTGFMLLDLDGFKDINDTLGHGIGDEVLTAIAHRMRAALPANVLVGRLGGDEFALLASNQDEVTLHELARAARRSIIEPLTVDGMGVSIEASVGITMAQPKDVAATELLRRADIAMYEAKQTGCGAVFFDSSLDGFSRRRLRRGEELRTAIAGGQLRVWYQPQVEARTRRIVAMEALVRWQHPTEGLVAPLTFLSDARRAGLMPALTEAVMRMTLRDAARWADSGLTFRVAMNWAPPELLAGHLLARLFDALDDVRLPPDRIQIEVTEDSFMTDPERARDVLFDLRAHGVQLAIDDYGTGFSSLAYLRDLPVQELKLDRAFVSTLLEDPRSRIIVETTVRMAHAFGLRLVVEGVEDEPVATELLRMGVDVLQGYHISPPMPAPEVEGWVRRWMTRSDLIDLAIQDPGPTTYR